MNVTLQLMILSIKHSKYREFQILVLDRKIPSAVYDGQKPLEECVMDIAEEYVEFRKGAYRPTLVDAVKTDDGLSIIYGFMIPDLLKIKLGGWMRMEDLFNAEQDLQKYCGYLYKIT